jgi:hypothetical protein
MRLAILCEAAANEALKITRSSEFEENAAIIGYVGGDYR